MSATTGLNTTVQTDISEASQSERIEKYMAQHGVKTQMNSNYLLNAFTLRNSENFSKMVLVMDAEKAEGKHVSYKNYVNKTSQETELDEIEDVLEDRHFDYVSRENHKANIVSKNKRFFGARYTCSKPIISRGQNLVCMPRFTQEVSFKEMVNEDIIDVYDCSEEEFWTSPEKVDIEDRDFYKFSL